MLINVLRDEAPTHVAVAFDVSRQTFRSETFAAYKANRTASPSEFSGQVSLVKEVLAALQIETVEKEGYEADDVIATLTTGRRPTGSTSSSVPATVTPTSWSATTSPSSIRAKVSPIWSGRHPRCCRRSTGWPPQYPDYAALRGDPSDNLPNIPGGREDRGPVGRPVRLPGGVGRTCRRGQGQGGRPAEAHLGQVLTNRQLTELVRDVPLDLRSDDLALRPWDREEVHRLFDTLQFRVLRDRLYQTWRRRFPRPTRDSMSTPCASRRAHWAPGSPPTPGRIRSACRSAVLGSGHGRGYGDRPGHGRGGRLVRPLGSGPG